MTITFTSIVSRPLPPSATSIKFTSLLKGTK
jgi:hypothetical protein